MPFFAEPSGEQAPELGLVLDDKYAHQRIVASPHEARVKHP